MHAVLRDTVVLLLATLIVAGEASAQTQQESAPAPEPIRGSAPVSETAPRSIPGILVTPPRPVPLPAQTHPQTCPDTGQKLELIG
jgi:hypothetical protein